MTIQKIAAIQRDEVEVIHFARKGTSDCFWFGRGGQVLSYHDAYPMGRPLTLDLYDLAATDWRVIK
jgi:hypothetical protein